MTNKLKLDTEIEARIAELERDIKRKRFELEDYTQELECLKDLNELRSKLRGDRLDADPDDDSRYCKYDDLPESYKKDNITFSESFGSAGEAILKLHKGAEMTPKQIACEAINSGILRSFADSIEGNLDQRMKSRWCLYIRNGMKPPFSIVKAEFSKSGFGEYVYH